MSINTYENIFRQLHNPNILDNKMLNLLHVPSDYSPSDPLKTPKNPKTVMCQLIEPGKKFFHLNEILHLSIQNKTLHALVVYVNNKAVECCEVQSETLRFPVINLKTNEHVYVDISKINYDDSTPFISEIVYWNDCNENCPLKDKYKLHIYDQNEKKINIYKPDYNNQNITDIHGSYKLLDWFNACVVDDEKNKGIKIFKVRPLAEPQKAEPQKAEPQKAEPQKAEPQKPSAKKPDAKKLK
jgi:hypothetical protein